MHVLGINYSNDAAASLVSDGRVIAAVQEERFTRIKHHSGFPSRAIDYCLAAGGITMEDVDHVAFFWNPGIHAEAMHRSSGAPRHHLEFLFNVPNFLLNKHFDGTGVRAMRQEIELASGKTLSIEYVTHHLTHAASAFYRSNFEDAAYLIVDGYGERSSSTIGRASGTSFETLLEVDFPHSVGSFYAAFTQYLGFKANNGEGKVMGLASYGQESRYTALVRDLITLTETGFEVDLTCFSYFLDRTRRYGQKFLDLLGPERKSNEPLTQRHYDIAYALQKATEEVLLHLARLTREKTGATRLVMAGGVVLNCVANGRIQQEAGFEECFFQPCAGDAGTSMGAALWVAHKYGDARVTHPLTDYLGPEFDNDAIEFSLKRAAVPGVRLHNTAEVAAEAIAAGRIIGWFQGRAEFGPRSLGNRSILCDPGRADMKDVLNARVKFREPFRPFAPSVLAEHATTYFDDGGRPSPFMLLVYDTRPEYAAVLPSITHVDGGARVQTVTRDQNTRYYDLIKAVGERTGIPCVVNTSFNIRGEPIVNTPEDALRCFFTTDMDDLFLGDWHITKPPA